MNRPLAFLALSVPILAWGLSFPSIKAALTEFPPMTLAFGRFLLAAAFLSIVSRFSKEPRIIRREHWRPLALSVGTGITAYFLFENHGVKLIPASAASLIIAGIPILTLLAERLVQGRRLGRLGAALLVGLPGGSAEAGNPWGYALMFGAALAWVYYLFAMRPLQHEYPGLTITTWQMVLGALSLAPFALTELRDWRWPSPAGWGHLAFQGLVCSAASYLLYNLALRQLGMRTASMAVNLIPVVTAVASYFLLGEVLGAWQWLGGGLVLTAVIVVSARPGTEAPPREG